METEFATGLATAGDGQTAGATAAAAAREGMAGDRVDFCHVFCSAEYDYEAVLSGIRGEIGEAATLFGCSGAGEFTQERMAETGVAVALVASDTIRFFTGLGTGLEEDVTGAVAEAARALPSAVDDHPYLSAINLHDGLAGVGEQLALVTQRRLGQHVSFAGGSAADDMHMESTHVFCDGQVADDAVGLALLASKEPLAITTGHGHEPISDPLVVTEAEGSVVTELDGRPAFEVWRDAVREPAREEFGVDVDALEPDSEELAKMLIRYEFGIDQGGEYKIRWPGQTTRTDGPLSFAVSIPEGTALRVMHSPEAEQIESARRAAREAVAAMDDRAIAGGFVYDCACRAAILESEFDRAIEAIGEEVPAPFAGFETYGEVCMQMGQLSGYHNTSTVVLLLPK